MLKSEEFVKKLGYKVAYLTTHDKQIFYSCCGYKFSEAVCAFGGSNKLNLGNFTKPPVSEKQGYIDAFLKKIEMLNRRIIALNWRKVYFSCISV